MKMIFTIIMLFAFVATANANNDTIPSTFKGKFIDDYGINYTVNDTLWIMEPRAKYHILKWNTAEQFIIARNDANNPTEQNLYTRIDYVLLPGMPPYQWGFCLSSYNASSPDSAENGYKADKQNPRKGCNGFPFSRMKPKDQ